MHIYMDRMHFIIMIIGIRVQVASRMYKVCTERQISHCAIH